MKCYLLLTFVLLSAQAAYAADSPCEKIMLKRECGPGKQACEGANSRRSDYNDCLKEEKKQKALRDDPNMHKGQTSDGPNQKK